MNHRNEKLSSQLSQLTAKFLRQAAGAQSLITVTGVEISTDGRRGTVLLSVLPEAAEQAALAFARRQRSRLRAYIFDHLRVGRLPLLDFALDLGEKHRQR